MAARFAEPQGGGLSMVQGGAAGLPPLLAETLLGLPLKAEFPAGASAMRAAIPAPNRSVLPKTMVQSEGGQAYCFFVVDL
jgi:hypothetical protein